MMPLPDIIFIALSAVMLISALMAISLKNVFYNAMFLILSLFCVAGIFIYLNSEFLAVIEIIIYIGAISIAIIFAIMLSRPMLQKHEVRDWEKISRAVLAAVAMGLGIWKVLSLSRFPVAPLSGDYSMKAVGKTFVTAALLPFEAVSVVLLIAIIGALVISNEKKS